jgi:D-tyrosyl-tRNA(Tyr) deacylase
MYNFDQDINTMRAVIQRCLATAKVKVNNHTEGEINKGLIVYLGIENEDNTEDISWMANKIVNMRIFGDEQGKMNLSVLDVKGSLLVISQFTLFASTKKGNRPSFIRSGKPDFANEMYERFKEYTKGQFDINVQSGKFAADMKVEYTNDGPVTIFIDSKNKE